MKKYWIEALGGLLALVTPFVQAHIWDPPQVLYWVLALLAADVGAHSYLLKKPPEPRKTLIRFLFTTFVLAVAHNLGKYVEVLQWLPGVVLLPTVLWHLRRLMRTGGELGWVEPGVVDMWELKFKRREEKEEDESPKPQSDDGSHAEGIPQPQSEPPAELPEPVAAARGPDAQ